MIQERRLSVTGDSYFKHLTHEQEVSGSINSWSGHLLLVLLPMIQERRLSVTGDNYFKYEHLVLVNP